MKVYLVEHSAGQWSDHSSYISAVLDNKRDAEAYAKKIEEYYDSVKRSEPPHNPDDYDKLSESEYEQLSEWQSKKYAADDFNSATVIEVEVGEVEKRFVK